MGLYRAIFRPLLFSLAPETSHRITLSLCTTLGGNRAGRGALHMLFERPNPRLKTSVAGMEFSSPIGLAAGFDKNGVAVEAMSRLGFGFVEIGSVSEMPSEGNRERPRLWRLPADESLRVYYGCPNDGAQVVAARLANVKVAVPLGVSLVETNTGAVASAEHAAGELSRCVGRFIGIADYIVLNLNCPNMPPGGCGLFDEPATLAFLLECCRTHAGLPPVFLKITPPGNPEDPRVIERILQAVAPFDFVKGFILNIHNPDPFGTLRTPRRELDRMRGGITGPSLRGPANAAIRAWYKLIDPARHVLIGVGGVTSGDDAYEMIRMGASLVELYTGLVFHGPGLVAQINHQLCELLDRDGYRSVGDAVGVSARRTDVNPAEAQAVLSPESA